MENFYSTVQNNSGNVVNGATVTVYDASTGLAATIYKPDGVTALANPFLSGYARSEGEIEFGAANGQYNIKIVNGVETDWIYRITLVDNSGITFGALAYEDNASGVPITDAGAYYASANVEGALQEAAADLAAHLADATDAHDASAVSIVDSGGFYSSVDVEGALQEVPSLPPAYAYFTENRNTTAPNATVPVHQWVVDGAETSIDIALSPKGAGAISAHVADNLATGGNKRGIYAVDLQNIRGINTQVSSGSYATIPGGNSNTASASFSTVSGGLGGNADGEASVIPGGKYGQARGLFGRYSFSSSYFSALGDSQIGRHVLSIITTDATATILTANALTPSSTNASVIPDNHAYAITARVIGRDTSTGDVYHIIAEGTAYRGTGAATVALDGTPVYTTISQSAGAAAWSVALVGNTTRGSAEIQVTGEAAKTIHWVCKFDTVEVG